MSKIVDTIRTLLGSVTEEERKAILADKTNLAKELLDGGADIVADGEFKKGAAVFVLNSDGEKVALPKGDYPLENGLVLLVGEDGKLTEDPKKVELENELTEERVAEMIASTLEPLKEQLRGIVKEELTKLMGEGYEEEEEKEKMSKVKLHKAKPLRSGSQVSEEKKPALYPSSGRSSLDNALAFISNQ